MAKYDMFFRYTETEVDISDTIEMTDPERDRLDAFLEVLQDEGVIDHYEIGTRSESATPFAGFVDFLQSDAAIEGAVENSEELAACMTAMRETVP